MLVLFLRIRYFGGHKLEAFMWDGFTNYNTKVRDAAVRLMARLPPPPYRTLGNGRTSFLLSFLNAP
jgi:hypothetical protein